jgi:hypothetical protein
VIELIEGIGETITIVADTMTMRIEIEDIIDIRKVDTDIVTKEVEAGIETEIERSIAQGKPIILLYFFVYDL